MNPDVSPMNAGREVNASAAAPARILVADDQAPNVQIVGAMLGKFGYEIIPASDGPTALKRLAIRLPDLILLDVLMPGMDGFEVLRRLKETPDLSHIPVIMLTAMGGDSDLSVGFDIGAADYICKPFSPVELVARVRRTLRQKGRGG